jgi:hypothetical protein
VVVLCGVVVPHGAVWCGVVVLCGVVVTHGAVWCRVVRCGRAVWCGCDSWCGMVVPHGVLWWFCHVACCHASSKETCHFISVITLYKILKSRLIPDLEL